MSKPTLVGVTGGIGSGKSTVCKIFETMGAQVYYADDRAKYLMENDPQLIEDIKSVFGQEAYQDGKLDRKRIAEFAFKDKQLLDRLNNAVHPAVKNDFERWVRNFSGEKILLKEAALLFETNSYQELDFTILVVANESNRIRRVLDRDIHRDEGMVKDIISKQLPDSKKIPLADFVVDNNGDQSLIEQVMKIHGSLV